MKKLKSYRKNEKKNIREMIKSCVINHEMNSKQKQVEKHALKNHTNIKNTFQKIIHELHE